VRTAGGLILLVVVGCSASRRRDERMVGRSTALDAGAESIVAPAQPGQPISARETDADGGIVGEVGEGSFVVQGRIGEGKYGQLKAGPGGAGSGYGVGCREEDGCHPRGRSRHPRVELEGLTVTGDLDYSLVRRPVYAQLPSIQQCYVARLEARPELAGVVIASFAIARNGSVIDVSASGVRDRVVEACVEAVIRAIRFPSREAGGVVNVSHCRFSLRPDE
jgi:hypothetical protein